MYHNYQVTKLVIIVISVNYTNQMYNGFIKVQIEIIIAKCCSEFAANIFYQQV